ncbi:amidohydrolase [Rhizorhabdus wittichii]|uniref:Amidohydrolase n=1 Tax=Rhizorhabdus wittichii TaxID=160791 RepID=A0A975HBY9_9SPHN|nr:amidohydrolase [Rhizorhabdus wittichii]QTH19920.1 amidohydrolase [Rhizorhabdus wittichii]
MRMMAKLLAGGALALVAAGAFAAEKPADMILLNGQVRTPGGWAEALAIRDGVIVAVGDAKAAEAWRGEGSKVVDLQGAAVLPGLHDMHVHVQSAGLEQYSCGFAYGAKPAAIAARVKECAAKAAPGAWIIGGNWVAAVFAKGQQNRAFLDKVAPNNPVFLSDESHHSGWVNSKALELAGITRDTKDPEGGVIDRDAKGNPTGVLREAGTFAVQKVIPAPTEALNRKALALATRQMLSYGITSFTDAWLDPQNLRTLSDLSGEGIVKQRVRGCIFWAPDDKDSERLIAARAFYAKPRFKPDCVKFMLDGVPTESHTAAMLHPYQGIAADDPKAKGILMVPQPALDEAVARFDRMGLHMKFHAAGDGAVRAAIDAVEHARKVNGWGGSSHELAHDSFVDRADIPRARALNLTWEFSPYIWYPTPIADVDVRKAVGDERMKRFTPIADAMATGANIIAGSDWSVVPSVNPWLAIETMVTRQSPGGSANSVGPDEKVTLDQALRMFTENAAAAMGDRDLVGSIEPGMHADIVVTEKNPFKVPVTEIHDTKVRMTFIDGELVYDAANPPPLTAE